METLLALFERTLLASLEAAAMVLLLVAVTAVFGRKLAPTWKYALWTLLLVKLMLPWLPGNLEGELRWTSPIGIVGEQISPIAHTTSRTTGAHVTNSATIRETHLPGSEPGLSAAAQDRPAAAVSAAEIAAIVWVAGTVAVLLYIAVGQIRMTAALRRETRVQVPDRLIALFDRIRTDSGIRANIHLRASNHVAAPALFGIFSPTVLIPAYMVSHLDDYEWECVFLHELSHFKRLDIAVNLAATVLASFHWFNPAVWYGLRVMRREQEIACDASVLNVWSLKESYASCIVKILELGASRKSLSAGVVGFSGYKNQMARRIVMIRNFQPAKKRVTILGLLVLFAAAALLLPSAFASGKPEAARNQTPAQTTVGTAAETPHETDAPASQQPEEIQFAVPTDGKVTAPFGFRIHPVTAKKSLHDGIDIANAKGTEVYAAADGKILKAEYDTKNGNTVIIAHNDTWRTEYRHLDKLTVEKGDEARAGELIGLMGSTGQSTGPHLHFSILENGEYVDPAKLLQ